MKITEDEKEHLAWVNACKRMEAPYREEVKKLLTSNGKFPTVWMQMPAGLHDDPRVLVLIVADDGSLINIGRLIAAGFGYHIDDDEYLVVYPTEDIPLVDRPTVHIQKLLEQVMGAPVKVAHPDTP